MLSVAVFRGGSSWQQQEEQQQQDGEEHRLAMPIPHPFNFLRSGGFQPYRMFYWQTDAQGRQAVPTGSELREWGMVDKIMSWALHDCLALLHLWLMS